MEIHRMIANWRHTWMRHSFLPDRPLLIDEYLGNAIELDVDAVCDGEEVLIGAIMEHLEEAESIQVTPPASSRHRISLKVYSQRLRNGPLLLA